MCLLYKLLVLLYLVSPLSGQTTHYDATRIWKHSRDIGMSALSGNVGDPGTRGYKDPAQYLNHHLSEDSQRSGSVGSVLIQSNPAGDLEGWSAVNQGNAPSSAVLQPGDGASGIYGIDNDGQTWYFLGPADKFSGNLQNVYNGQLSFQLIHAETPSTGKIKRVPDILLEATCGHSMQLFDFAGQGGQLSISLNEGAGWIDSRTKRPPSAMDMLGVLSNLGALKIRGGYFQGREVTVLSSIAINVGLPWFPCCNMDGTVDICAKQPSTYYSPPNLKFYCEGHLYKPVRVTRILPRFSRRSGGATITIIGENFGLSGSQPIVRINNAPCQRTFFAPQVFRNEYSSSPETATSNAYGLMGTGDILTQPSNPSGNALVNSYNSATDSMKQQYPEHCWNGMQDDGSDKGFNYGTSSSPKYINQGETGVDTGGPCFPEHCSSCPVPTKASTAGSNLGAGGVAGFRCSASNQITAVSSASCKGRGNDAVACPYNFPYLKYPNPCPEDAPYTSSIKTAFSGPSGSAYVSRDAFQQYRWNREGIYAGISSDHQIVEGMTRITHPNPAADSTLGSASFSTQITTIEIEDAVALCGFHIRSIGFSGGSEVVLNDALFTKSTISVTLTPANTTSLYFNGMTVSAATPAYIMIEKEIMMISAVSNTALTVAQRGSFGTGISAHPNNVVVRIVEVCRNVAISIAPAASTGKNSMIVAVPFNAVCQGYSQAFAEDGRSCTLTISSTDELKNTLNVGDLVRRVSTGRTLVSASQVAGVLAVSGTTLVVDSAAGLFGTASSGVISCGSDVNIDVTAIDLVSNSLTLNPATVDNVAVASTCIIGSVVSVVSSGWTKIDPTQTSLISSSTSVQVVSALQLLGETATGPKSIVCGSSTLVFTAVTLNVLTITAPDSYFSNVAAASTCTPGTVVTLEGGRSLNGMLSAPVGQQYITTFDLLSSLELPSSDVAEFSDHRYLKVDDEIVRIVNLADSNGDVSAGNERITVARAQLGTHAAAHARDSIVTLLPRMTEISAPVTISDSKLYFPSAYDIISNNIGVFTPGVGVQGGGTNLIAYLKLDDEIVKVIEMQTDYNEASVTVLRGQRGTLATNHKAGTVVHVLSCMDADEFGDNCGGSCKPCPSSSRGGPAQQTSLLCITPQGDSGPGPSGQGSGDLPVTVEASPGAQESPFSVRMQSDMTSWVDFSTTAISCISEQSRGFQYGAHDFVWGVHLKSADQGEEVKISDMSVDRNTGESYVVGTMQGTLTIQGKHIAMSKVIPGELTVSLAAGASISGVAQGYSGTTITLAASGFGTTDDYVGKTVKITSSSKGNSNCMATIAAYSGGTGLTPIAGTNIATTGAAFKRLSDGVPCDMSTTETAGYTIYNGRGSFIAKFSKDGRPLWLNKIDTANQGQDAVITSISVDPTGEVGGGPVHYITGYYSDALPGTAASTNVVLNIYNVESTSRVASTTGTAATLSTLNVDSYGQISTQVPEGRSYQEGFLIKYNGHGQYIASESIKGTTAYQQLQISNLRVRSFHPASSAAINSQVLSDSAPPTVRTATSRSDVEYDRGMAVSAIQGGGTQLLSSIVLALSAATTNPGAGQSLSSTGTYRDKWYNGLTITITCGKGMGQSRTIQDYVASTRTAYVQPHWDGTGEMTPDSTSCYIISGRPSSNIQGQHWSSGGVYVTGKAVGISAGSTMCFGQMPDAYRDSNAVGTGIPVCSKFSALANEEQNFIAQYDRNLRAFWVRFTYDSAVMPTGATTVAAGAVTLANGGTILAVTSASALLGFSGSLTLTCGLGKGTVSIIDIVGTAIQFSELTPIYFTGTTCTSSLGSTVSLTTGLGTVAAATPVTVTLSEIKQLFFSKILNALPSTIAISCGDDISMSLSSVNLGTGVLTLDGTTVNQLGTAATGGQICAAPGGSPGAAVWLISTASASNSGQISSVTTMQDFIYVTGTFGYAATGADLVSMRLQNCSFDSSTVTEGPPSNTQPIVVTLKKLCRTENIGLTNVGLFPSQSSNSQLGGPAMQFGYSPDASMDYTVLNTMAADYVQIPFAPLASSTKQLMYVAGYDASGSLVWFHFVQPDGGMSGYNDNIWIEPAALAHVQPSLGGRPLMGTWNSVSDTERTLTGGQPSDSTAAKDISSERADSATVNGGFIYVAGHIKTATVGHLADFGLTKYPLECSHGKSIGKHGADISVMINAPCAGKIQSQQSDAVGVPSYDVFLSKYAAKGAPRSTDQSILSYSVWKAVGTTNAASSTTFELNPLDVASSNLYKNTQIFLRLNDGTPVAAVIQSNTPPSVPATGGGTVTLSSAATFIPTHYTFNRIPTYGSGAQPELHFIRRTGLKDVDEKATAVEVHDLTGSIYVAGNYKASSLSKYQGSDSGESLSLASQDNDGSFTYTASRVSGVSSNSGDDHFGLQAAGRVSTVGCPMQRYSPNGEYEERLGLTGIPDCTLYSHAAAITTETGFVVKFNDNGDQTQRGNKNRIKVPSITGYLVGNGSPHSTTIAPCSSGVADAGGTLHVLTGSALCSTSPRGCSCVVLKVQSMGVGVVDQDSGSGSSSRWSGMRLRISQGKAAGFEGIISGYDVLNHAYNIIPALPVQPDETSFFQLNPWAELSSKIHKANCDAILDKGCSAYGVEWAKTIGWPIGQTKTTYGPYGSPPDTLNSDQGTWKSVGGISTAQGIFLDSSDVTSNVNKFLGYAVYISAAIKPPWQPYEVAVVTGYVQSSTTTDGGLIGITCPGNPGGACSVIATKYRLAAKSANPYQDAGSASVLTSLVLSSTDDGSLNLYSGKYASLISSAGAVQIASITASSATTATIECRDSAGVLMTCVTAVKYAIFDARSVASAPASSATSLVLDPKDGASLDQYKNAFVYLFSGLSVQLAYITAYSVPSSLADGGSATIACTAALSNAGGGGTSATTCITASKYAFATLPKASSSGGIRNVASVGYHEHSQSVSLTMHGSDIFVGGIFSGFDRFHFGIEGVDETVGFKNVGDDTLESYLLKLED